MNKIKNLKNFINEDYSIGSILKKGKEMVSGVGMLTIESKESGAKKCPKCKLFFSQINKYFAIYSYYSSHLKYFWRKHKPKSSSEDRMGFV